MDSYITKLEPHQIFCFGSNTSGNHFGGAARQAYEDFGALMGIGFGRAGSTYAIPTLYGTGQQLSLQSISHYLLQFSEYAKTHKDTEFLLTKVGTGIAGFTEEEMESIMPAFPSNVIRI